MKTFAAAAIAVTTMLASPAAHAGEAPQTASVLKTITDLQLYTREQAIDEPGQSLSRAAANGETGETTITCHITDDKSVDMCIVLKELPPRHGLGQMAAYDIMRMGRADDDTLIGTWIRQTFRFGQQ